MIISWLVMASLTSVSGDSPPSAGGRFDIYDEASLRLVVPFGRGGATDLIFRGIASHAVPYLGEGIEIVNIPGAGATRGASAVRKASPDGYTVLGTHQALIHAYLGGVVPYSHRDLAPVALLARTINIPTTHSNHPVRTAAQIAPYILSRRGEVRIGVIPHSTAHFFWNQLLREIGVSSQLVTVIQFPDSASKVTALLAQEIDFAMLDLPSAGHLYETGSLVALGVAHDQRLVRLPEVPTLQEQGIGLYHTSNRGLFAPKGTSPQRLARLADAFGQAMQSRELTNRLELEFGSIVDFRPLHEFEGFLEQQFVELQKFPGEER